MKSVICYVSFFLLLTIPSSTDAFSTPLVQQSGVAKIKSSTKATTALKMSYNDNDNGNGKTQQQWKSDNEPKTINDKKKNKTSSVAATMLGMSFMAMMTMTMMTTSTISPAYAETSLDFSLPAYDTKMSGFGEGTEARLNPGTTTGGMTEKELQMQAMRKAEAARQERLKAEKAKAKAREEEDKRRALEKKKENAERLQNIWN